MTEDRKGNNQGTDEEKVGVYICHCGGNISDHVDVHKVAEQVKALPGVVRVHTNTFMCSDPGQELIQKEIRDGSINRVVVASCAPSLHELTFRSAIDRADMNPYLYEHANIREQVSWVHHGEKATRKATTLVSAAVAKTKKLIPLEPIRVDASRHAVVIGGGVAGMRAAIDLARLGIGVALIEKTPYLGGRTARLNTLVPTEERADELIRSLASQVCADPRITVHTCSEITHSEGYVGNFKITLQRSVPSIDRPDSDPVPSGEARCRPGDYVPLRGFLHSALPSTTETISLETGAVLFATGFSLYRPGEGEYGYLENREVVTLPEFIERMATEKTSGPRLKWNGREIHRIAFIHCVGSRQIPGIHKPSAAGHLNEYCSRTCCSATLQAAVRIRENHPGTHVLEYYRDIRTYGRGHEAYYERASENHVLFFRFEPEDPPLVEPVRNGKYPLRITVKDTLTFGEELTAEVDLVVLSVGMEPSRIDKLVEMMKLPVGADRFLQEVHPKLRPVEMANTGVMIAGTCQAPMDVGEACSAAQAASAKAATMLAKGYVELDPFVASVDTGRCKGHGACSKVCPVDSAVVLTDVENDGMQQRQAVVNPALCTGCGICVAACPENAIEVNGWSLKQYEVMVDAIVAA